MAFGDLVARLMLDAAPFRREMEQQAGIIRRFSSGLAAGLAPAASGFAKIGRAAQQQQRLIQNFAGGLTSGLGSAVRGFAQLGLAVQGAQAAMTGLDRLVGTPLRLAAAAEQTSIAFRVMVGDAEKSQGLIRDIRKFAAETPFGQQESLTAGRQLLAFGFDPGQIAGELRMLGDIAAGVAAPLGDLVFLHGTLNAQGRAYAVDIRQLAMRGIPIYEALADVMGTNVEELKEMVSEGSVGFAEVQKALRSMTEEGGRFHGLSEEMLQSATGGWDKLQDAIQMAQIDLGNALIKELNLKQVISDASELADVFKQDVVPAIADVLQWSAKLGKELGDQFSHIQDGIELFARAMTKLDETSLFSVTPNDIVQAFEEARQELAQDKAQVEIQAEIVNRQELVKQIQDALENKPVDVQVMPIADRKFFDDLDKKLKADEKFAKELTATAKPPEQQLGEDFERLQGMRERGLIDVPALMAGLEQARDRFADALELTPGEEAERFLASLKSFGNGMFGDPELRALLRSGGISQSLAGPNDQRQLASFNEFAEQLKALRPDVAGRQDVQGLFDQFRNRVTTGGPEGDQDAFAEFQKAFERLTGMAGQEGRGLEAAAEQLQKSFFRGEGEPSHVRSLERGTMEEFEVLRNAFAPREGDNPLVELQQQANEHLAAIAANTAGENKRPLFGTPEFSDWVNDLEGRSDPVAAAVVQPDPITAAVVQPDPIAVQAVSPSPVDIPVVQPPPIDVPVVQPDIVTAATVQPEPIPPRPLTIQEAAANIPNVDPILYPTDNLPRKAIEAAAMQVQPVPYLPDTVTPPPDSAPSGVDMDRLHDQLNRQTGASGLVSRMALDVFEALVPTDPNNAMFGPTEPPAAGDVGTQLGGIGGFATAYSEARRTADLRRRGSAPGFALGMPAVEPVADPFRDTDDRAVAQQAEDLRSGMNEKTTRLLEQVAAAAKETAKNTKQQPPKGQTVNVRVANDI